MLKRKIAFFVMVCVYVYMMCGQTLLFYSLIYYFNKPYPDGQKRIKIIDNQLL